MPAVDGFGQLAGIGTLREAMMQSAGRLYVAAAAALGLFGILGEMAETAGAADRPTPAASLRVTPAASSDSVASGNQLQLGRRRIGQAYVAGSTSQAPATDAPPAPVDPDAPATETPASPQIVESGNGAPPNVASPQIPFVAPRGASAIHERLRAKRMARVQQMKQQAQQNGDTQGVERAQYLEGMVNELHNKGLFNFGQKVMSAMQEGKLKLPGSGEPAASGSSIELPETDLGESAPLPETDLGAPAALPTDGAAPEAVPQLPPAPDDGGDAPPANN